MQPRTRRIMVLAITFLLIGIILALTLTLPQLQLKTNNQFQMPAEGTPEGDVLIFETSDAMSSVFIRVAMLVMVILFILLPIFMIMERKGWRWWLSIAALLAVLLFWLSHLNQEAIDMPTEPTGTMETTPIEIMLSPFTEDLRNLEPFNPDRAEWAIRGLFIALGLLIAGIASGLFWMILNARRSTTLNPELEGIGEQVEQALTALQAGEDVGETIQRCYLNMSVLLSETRNLQRGQAMTPAEFAQALRGQHLPEDALDELTHLFELVRYGEYQADVSTQQRAIDCLMAIKEAVADRLDQ